MAVHPDIELQILQHLRALREEVAVLSARVENIALRLDAAPAGGADTPSKPET